MSIVHAYTIAIVATEMIALLRKTVGTTPVLKTLA